jgi:hypothetical protein
VRRASRREPHVQRSVPLKSRRKPLLHAPSTG